MTTLLSADLVDELRRTVIGTVVTAGHSPYDEARAVWNAMVDARPAVVVRAADEGDVAPVIAFARAHDLPLAVRGGGHNVAGKGTVDGGVVLDLADLRAVLVDAPSGTVRVQGGATLADVDAATTPHGLAVPLGVISATGVGGLTLGGGVGWLTRKHGLAADNLLGARVVLADGRTEIATEEENPDLLWALRGGGGNFGVVTELTFRAHPLGPDVLTGNLVYAADRWPQAWRALAAWTADLPDEMTTITSTLTPPPMLEMGDQPLLLVGCAWASDDVAAGQAHIDRLRVLAPPDDEVVAVTPWPQWQSSVDAVFPKGVRAYWRNASFDRLDDDVIDVLVRRGREQTWIGTAYDVHHMGGAFGRFGSDHGPFPGRDAQFWVNVYGFWEDAADDPDRVAFVRGMSADLEPFATGGHYVNFQGLEEVGHRVLDPAAVFGPEVHARLVEVKRRFDPDNVFRINLNIRPE